MEVAHWYKFYMWAENTCRENNIKNREDIKMVLPRITKDGKLELDPEQKEFFEKLFEMANCTVNCEMPFHVEQRIKIDDNSYHIIKQFKYELASLYNDLIVPELNDFEVEVYENDKFKERIKIEDPLEFYKYNNLSKY